MDNDYVISTIIAIRKSSVSEVEKLHTKLKNDHRFTLKKFEYQHKEIKAKGEVVDEYELVKATLIFNEEKEPLCRVSIDFELDNGNFPIAESYEEDGE